MKQNQITLIIIGFIIVALLATNPSTEEHKDAIKKEIFKAIESDNNSNSAQQLGEKIGESIGGALIDNMVERQNYVLFSLATVKIVKQDGVSNNAITLGVFGQIILLKKYDKDSKEFVDNKSFNGAESYVTTDTAAPITSTIENNKNSDQKIPDYIASEDDATNADGDIIDFIGKPIKIENLEVAQNDFPREMNWNEAKIACKRLGSGWRLPNKDELNIMYQNKDKIGSFAVGEYWSSTEGATFSFYAFYQYFVSGSQSDGDKNLSKYVRAVRTTK